MTLSLLISSAPGMEILPAHQGLQSPVLVRSLAPRPRSRIVGKIARQGSRMEALATNLDGGGDPCARGWHRSMQPFCTLRAIFGFHRPGALSRRSPKAYK